MKFLPNSAKSVLFFIALHFYSSPIIAQQDLEIPGRNEYCKVNPSGKSILPSGRWVSPVGEAKTITRAWNEFFTENNSSII